MNKNSCLDPIPDVKDLHLYVVSSPASTAEIRWASLEHSSLQSSKIQDKEVQSPDQKLIGELEMDAWVMRLAQFWMQVGDAGGLICTMWG